MINRKIFSKSGSWGAGMLHIHVNIWSAEAPDPCSLSFSLACLTMCFCVCVSWKILRECMTPKFARHREANTFCTRPNLALVLVNFHSSVTGIYGANSAMQSMD